MTPRHGACAALTPLGGPSVVEPVRALPWRLRGVCKFFASYSCSLYLVHGTVLVFERHHRQVGLVLKRLTGARGVRSPPNACRGHPLERP